VTRVVFESRIEASPARVFAFHERPDAFRLLTPWWSAARVVRPAASLRPGERALLVVGWGPLAQEWEAVHDVYAPPDYFEEHQLRGPFRRWRHRHLMLADGTGCRLRDELDFAAPGGPLVDRLLALSFLRVLFAYRHRVTRRALAAGGFETGQ